MVIREVNPNRKYYNGDLSLLAGHLHEPTVQTPVMEFIKKAEAPLLFREIVQATGLPRSSVHRVVRRMLLKGVLGRYESTQTYHLPVTNKSVRAKPGAAIRKAWLYYYIPESERGK